MNLVSSTPTTRTFEEFEVVCECEPPKRKVQVESVDPTNEADRLDAGVDGVDGVGAADRAAFQLKGDGVDFGRVNQGAAALEAAADPNDIGARGIDRATPADREMQELLRRLRA